MPINEISEIEEEVKRRAKRDSVKKVSADYKAEPEDLKLYSKITGLSNETVERLKRRSEVSDRMRKGTWIIGGTVMLGLLLVSAVGFATTVADNWSLVGGTHTFSSGFPVQTGPLVNTATLQIVTDGTAVGGLHQGNTSTVYDYVPGMLPWGSNVNTTSHVDGQFSQMNYDWDSATKFTTAGTSLEIHSFTIGDDYSYDVKHDSFWTAQLGGSEGLVVNLTGANTSLNTFLLDSSRIIPGPGPAVVNVNLMTTTGTGKLTANANQWWGTLDGQDRIWGDVNATGSGVFSIAAFSLGTWDGYVKGKPDAALSWTVVDDDGVTGMSGPLIIAYGSSLDFKNNFGVNLDGTPGNEDRAGYDYDFQGRGVLP